MEEDVGLNIKHMAGNIYESKYFLEETFRWENIRKQERRYFVEETFHWENIRKQERRYFVIETLRWENIR